MRGMGASASPIPRYFHASTQKLPEIVEPMGYYEMIDDDTGEPVTAPFSEGEEFLISDTPEIVFAKNVGGAVLGAATSFNSEHPAIAQKKPVTLYIYETEQEPWVDLSDNVSDWIDFDVTKEVRYREPVEVKLVGKVELTQNDLKRVSKAYAREEHAYGGYFAAPKEPQEKLVREFDKRLKH